MANRKLQISKIQDKTYALSGGLDILIDELQDAFNNMPESFQESERGVRVEERIDTLTDWRDSLTDMAEADSV